AEATDLLRAAQIPFELDAATGGITVPEKNLHDARLKLAGSGLTDSGLPFANWIIENVVPSLRDLRSTIFSVWIAYTVVW
ncbi:hypothetical protein KC218_27925, partial [Mycobacterium tuberculosis]|nr:hypothetical protein [Mycobacterium tuberculosis]